MALENNTSNTLSKIPRHVAVIMDGNNRWARSNKLAMGAGHRAGIKAVRRVTEFCAKSGVEVLTLFAFSSENWNRPPKEVSLLMKLLRQVIKTEVEKLHKNNVKVLVIGDRSRFDESLQQKMTESELLTANNTGLVLAVAANYGGQWDITNAVKKIATKVQAGQLSAQDITNDIIEKELCLHQYSAPDLCIRTGGEIRISNFLLWQLAYTELYFTDVLWPDFSEQDLTQAFQAYASRQRRFGQTIEQVQNGKINA